MAGRPRTRARALALGDETAAVLEADRAEVIQPRTVAQAYKRSEPFLLTGYQMTLREMVDHARSKAPRSLDVLEEIRDNEEMPGIVRATCAGMLLDRAYGRAFQSIAIADVTNRSNLDLSALSAEELVLLEKLLGKASRAQQSGGIVDVSPLGKAKAD